MWFEKAEDGNVWVCVRMCKDESENVLEECWVDRNNQCACL